MTTIHIVTIFPHIFDSFITESIVGRAQKKEVVKILTWPLRDFTTDKHQTVDRKPFGGGAGMVMSIEPIYKCLKSIHSYIQKDLGSTTDSTDVWPMGFAQGKVKTILMSPKGGLFTQNTAREYSELQHLIIICGHYEGVDERVLHFVDEEVSIGQYVLSGGESAANVIVDAVVRILPNSLGNPESIVTETFSDTDLLSQDFPSYTRPENFILDNGEVLSVPKILLSGHHKQIQDWRISQ